MLGAAAPMPSPTRARPTGGRACGRHRGQGGRARSASKLLGTAIGPATYLIRLVEPAVPSYDGGSVGLRRYGAGAGCAARRRQPAGAGRTGATSRRTRPSSSTGWSAPPGETSRCSSPTSTPSTGWLRCSPLTRPRHGRRPDVASIAPDQERELHTDAGPQWENADALWNAEEELGLPEDIHGEGVDHRHDRHRHQPQQPVLRRHRRRRLRPREPLGAGVYLGVCDPANTSSTTPRSRATTSSSGPTSSAGPTTPPTTTTGTARTPPPPPAATW